jgi:hypothetical protein
MLVALQPQSPLLKSWIADRLCRTTQAAVSFPERTPLKRAPYLVSPKFWIPSEQLPFHD